ncbi:MAG: UDP-2,3-diacylglucosamine diphosphatase [Bdellovibrionales bacterium]
MIDNLRPSNGHGADGGSCAAPARALRFRAIWISDLHLGTRGCKAKALVDFLDHVESDYLYLVGDIVDGWRLRKRWYWPARHNDVIQRVIRRAQQGTRVVYLPGNHDEAARQFCGLNFGGIPVVDEIVHETADGRRLLVLHGDQFDAVVGCAKWLAHLGDYAYSFAMVVSAVFNFVRQNMGFPYWSLSAWLKHKVKNAVDHIGDYENFIVERAGHHRATGVVCGHIHYADIRQVGSVLYCNDGDWVESCTALVEDFEGKLSLIRWREERESLLGAAT